ncbi:MAG: hypothetical protein ACTTJK_04020 [Phocaeicola sp.]|uniref:hypothetical protein n=1 Tax=Phocaeicola sp. TaxID=2773926 RepID=UPI003F9EFB4F
MMKNIFSMAMRKPLILLAALLLTGCSGSFLDRFKNTEMESIKAVENDFTFSGYTDHWQNIYSRQYRYGNLYRINIPDLEKSILQSKVDVAESLGIPGLQMQEGFVNGLVRVNYAILENPTVDQLKDAFNSTADILAFVERTSETGKMLSEKDPMKVCSLHNYQSKAKDFSTLSAFVLQNGKKNLYVALGEKTQLDMLNGIIKNTKEVVTGYDMKRGWFACESNIRTVTCAPGNPIDVMGMGMNEGNSWFVFNGYQEFNAHNQIVDWVNEANNVVIADLGSAPIYGCDDYDGLQVQMMGASELWLKFREEKHGYLFRNMPNVKDINDQMPEAKYDGYYANIGQANQINHSDKPFVIRTGPTLGGLTNSMVLFNKKGDSFDRAKMWDAIMSRRAVAVAEKGVIMGSDQFRQAMQLLYLDRVYLEDYFGDRLHLNSRVEGKDLHITVSNLYSHQISGTITVGLPKGVTMKGDALQKVQLTAGSTKELVLELTPSVEAMGSIHPIVVKFDGDNASKSTMASLDLAPVISEHQLLYGPASGFQFPVTVHNFTDNENVDVKISIASKDNPNKVLATDSKSAQIKKGTFATVIFDIKQASGSYIVTTEALGTTTQSQVGISDEAGEVALKEVDIDGDGVNEYVMENDQVRVTLLTTGARIIEYYLKSKDDNLFFKLWPEKPNDVDRPFREWGFYPYGGFEDFLGQASVETHKVYKAEVVKKGGSYAEVKMTADFYGSVIEKTFSLYGNTPLLGIRFALTMIHPEMNVLGPQPILSIGKTHGTEDKFIIPEVGGNQEYVMNPNKMWGKTLTLQEGWNAGYDTRENISFVGAYPVHRPYFLHMWMNLETNGDSHYPYTELQPWLPLYQNTTSYFSYYMWAAGSSWETGVKELRDRNLITER